MQSGFCLSPIVFLSSFANPIAGLGADKSKIKGSIFSCDFLTSSSFV